MFGKSGATGKHSYFIRKKNCNAFEIVTVLLSPHWNVDLSGYTLDSVAKKGKPVIQISQR